MNVELAKRVESRICNLQVDEHFDQSGWGVKDRCGTTACIAGWTLIEAGEFEWDEVGTIKPLGHYNIEFAAGELLGLSESQRKSLFYKPNEEEALELLRYLIEEAE